MSESRTEISKEILLEWKKGNIKAFEEIVEVSRGRAYSCALGIVGNIEDARDLSQEAFMAAYNARKSFDPEKPFFPWFYRILRNRCLNFIRSRARKKEISLDVLIEKESTQLAPDAGLMKKENAEALWKGLFTLSEEHREVLILRSFYDLSYKEISESLGISEGTVMSRLFYARKALYGILKDRFDEFPGEGDDS
ncbi:MAG: RNA polymerase sigma factor [Candidatus Krumholzibacteriota bacterium]|nr:RNA polymerase sigma factor [Candidatus Krumholzibacteriota bacterium]